MARKRNDEERRDGKDETEKAKHGTCTKDETVKVQMGKTKQIPTNETGKTKVKKRNGKVDQTKGRIRGSRKRTANTKRKRVNGKDETEKTTYMEKTNGRDKR